MIPINLPVGAKLITNNLMEHPSPADLEQDLVLVELPGELFIDVSWFPENDIIGIYWVKVFEKTEFDDPLYSIGAGGPQSAADWVKILAKRYTSLERRGS